MKLTWPNKPEKLVKADCHLHTKFCGHAKGEMENYIQAAITKGLTQVLFLAHLESGVNYHRKNWLNTPEFSLYFKEGCRLQDKYGHLVKIGLGLEVGYNRSPDNHPYLREIINSRPWDAIALSYHYIPAKPFDLNVCCNHPERKEILCQQDHLALAKNYYQALLEGIEVIKPDFLCHLDIIGKSLPLNMNQESQITLEIWKLVEKILDKIVTRGIMVEINTSGFIHRQEQYPCNAILQQILKKKVGILLGSDSHAPDQVGRFFSTSQSLIWPEHP